MIGLIKPRTPARKLINIVSGMSGKMRIFAGRETSENTPVL